MVINKTSFFSYLFRISQEKSYKVFVPEQGFFNVNKSPTYFFSKIKNSTINDVNKYRTIDPVKILFYLFRERVYPVEHRSEKRILVGVKACDLNALLLLDKALTESGFVDPAYKQWRDNTLIISSDCYEIHETCSCNLVDSLPYPTRGYDINISSIENELILEVGSDRGSNFLAELSKEFVLRESTPEELKEITEKRNSILEKLNRNNSHLKIDKNYLSFRRVDKSVWEEESKTCIGCGACTNICPTCYCLILNDESTENNFVKVRSYDSCQWFGYARVAGGGTPRPKMVDRFRHRYLCKFDYTFRNFETIGCTGCGRCTEACVGKINFREVIKRVSSSLLSNEIHS